MSGDILLNLDSEDEGEIFIGCAGGIDSVAEFTYKEASVAQRSLPDMQKELRNLRKEIEELKQLLNK